MVKEIQKEKSIMIIQFYIFFEGKYLMVKNIIGILSIGFLIYEGIYLNGERNGKGKDYEIKGNIIFEGEYSNGKKWEGKIFDIQNNNIHELKNGKGFIKEYCYDENNKVITNQLYEGEYSNGLKNEKGKVYF